MMRQKTLLGAVAALLVLGAILGSAMGQTPAQPTEKLIHTSTTGEVLAPPDQVEISLAVQTENIDARIAQQKNADLMTAIVAALERAGIPADRMKTTGYNIYPVYDSSSPLSPKIRTYQVTNTLLVTLTDPTRAGEITDLAVSTGANQVNYISFTLSDERQRALRTEALRDAMTLSRSDADTVAASSGLVITGVKEITVSGGYTPIPLRDYSYAIGAEKSVTPVVPGDITVTASVSVTYTCS